MRKSSSDPLIGLFDKDRIKVENHAIGGRSSRTFQTEGRWDRILAAAKPGDFVLIQMGHNDGGPLDDPARARGSLRGTGDETREIDNPITKKKEVVHTYGWYLRKYVNDAKAKAVDSRSAQPKKNILRNTITSSVGKAPEKIIIPFYNRGHRETRRAFFLKSRP